MSDKYDAPAGPPPAYVAPKNTGSPAPGANESYYGSPAPQQYPNQQVGPYGPPAQQQQQQQQQPYAMQQQQQWPGQGQQVYYGGGQPMYGPPQQGGMYYQQQQPMYGAPRGGYYDGHRGGASEGILAGLCGALACCCCLDLLF